VKLVEGTLDHLMIARPTPTEEEPQHLCLDAGYDYDAVYETVRAHHYVPHIRPNLHNRVPTKPVPEPEAGIQYSFLGSLLGSGCSTMGTAHWFLLLMRSGCSFSMSIPEREPFCQDKV
jgi:hypothetical protein